ncbi:uncharacterized protein LOC124272464 isoform X2 [Haliotis rubra]|uniref:uncharacterized protein LOC124272464 isoform X2 n=1 Tax=Haliotis rubra TaxID=36100 RepID=UPI001EE61869|nr:uncharacterized protein LOC124272464 isoform X2 [Haliotis rubra]
MDRTYQPSVICAPVGANTDDDKGCNESSNYKADSHTGKQCSDHLELLSATGACNSSLSYCNAAGIVHGGINTTHAATCNFYINSSGAKETRICDNDTEKGNHSGRKASVGTIEISLTSQGVDIKLGCPDGNDPNMPSQLTEDNSNSVLKIGGTGTPCDGSETSVPKGTKSSIQEDRSSSSYRPTIGVALPDIGLWEWLKDSFSSNPGTSEPDTDEGSYSCEEVDDFILVSPSDITLQGKVKISSHDITDGKDLHPTNSKRAFIHQEDANGSNGGNLVANPSQNHENQIPITLLQEDTNVTAESAAKEHSNKVRPGSDHLGNIKSLHPHTEPNDYFHLERLLAAVNTIQEPWGSFTEGALLSLLAVAEKGDVAQVIYIDRFLRNKMIEIPNGFHPTANHQSFFNDVKVLQRIRNLSDHVRWRTEQNMSYIVKIAQWDPSKIKDIITFLDDFFLNQPN